MRPRDCNLPAHHPFHAGTTWTMFGIICARAVSISFDGSVRVLVRTAQQMPFAVRAIMVVDPGRLPLCLHKVLAVAHAHGFVIDELVVAGDRNRTGGD